MRSRRKTPSRDPALISQLPPLGRRRFLMCPFLGAGYRLAGSGHTERSDPILASVHLAPLIEHGHTGHRRREAANRERQRSRLLVHDRAGEPGPQELA